MFAFFLTVQRRRIWTENKNKLIENAQTPVRDSIIEEEVVERYRSAFTATDI